jgi:ATP-binding cassette subfamily B multidrug efflux pump
MNNFGTASLITRNTNDIQQIQLFLQMALTMMVIAPIMCVGRHHPRHPRGRPALDAAAGGRAGDGVFIGTVMVKVIPQFRSMQGKIDRINEVLREQITGVRVIRAFVRNNSEAERFAVANADLTDTALRVNRIFALALPAMMVILNLSSVAVLWFGGRLVSEGSMPIGNLTAFLTYILQILLSVMMAGDGGDPAAARGGERRARRAGPQHRAGDRRPDEPERSRSRSGACDSRTSPSPTRAASGRS